MGGFECPLWGKKRTFGPESEWRNQDKTGSLGLDEKAKPAERRGRKATGLRVLRDADTTPPGALYYGRSLSIIYLGGSR